MILDLAKAPSTQRRSIWLIDLPQSGARRYRGYPRHQSFPRPLCVLGVLGVHYPACDSAQRLALDAPFGSGSAGFGQ